MNKRKIRLSYIFNIIMGFHLSLSSCVKSEWIIDDIRESQNYELSNAVKNIVYFNPRIESNFITRTLTPFPAGCYVKIFVFADTEGSQSMFSPLYESLKAGTLTPTQNAIALPTGEYDFYAVSIKSDSLPPPFEQNYSSSLSNNVDYLWSGVKNHAVGTSGTTIDLTFSHTASQLVFNISNGSTNYLKSIKSATMNVAKATDLSKWNLLTGEISQVNAAPVVSQSMDVDDFVLSGICLPYINDSTSVVTVSAINDKSTAFSFSFNIPQPSNGFESGDSCQYDVIVDPDIIYVSQVMVAPWKEVTGIIIYSK